MFYEILWVAFLVELMVGILVGWLLANYYFQRRESIELAAIEDDTTDVPLFRLDGTGSSGKAGVIQALKQDRATIQKQVLRLEQSLAQSEALLDKAHNDLATDRVALAQSEALLDKAHNDLATNRAALAQSDIVSKQRESEIENLKATMAEVQAMNASLVSQVAHHQKATAEAQALAKMLEQSKADLSKTAMRLQADLEEVLQSRERISDQLAVDKEKLRMAAEQIERAKSP